MADRKISQLPAVDSVLAADELPIVRPAASWKATVTQLAAAVGLISVARQNTIIVDQGGNGDYTSLAAAMAGISSPAADNRWRVLVYGHFTESATVSVPSYTTIEGVGVASVALADAADTHLFANADQVNGNTDIAIRNLHIDANRAGQTNGQLGNVSHAVNMVGVTGLTLEDVHVLNALDDGFKLKDCTNLYIANVGVDGAGTEGWSIDNCAYGQLSNVYARNIDGLDANGADDRPGGSVAWGFEVEDGSNHLEFANVVCEDCTRGGGWHTQSHTEGNIGYITVHGLICTGWLNDGVTVTGLNGPVSIDGMHLAGTGMGILVTALAPVTISNFYISATSRGVYCYYGGTGLRMMNGTILATGSGVDFDAGTAAQLIGVAVDMTAHADYAGMALPAAASAIGCQFTGGAYGLASVGAGSIVTGCQFTGQGTDGINDAGIDPAAVVANNVGA